MSEQQKNHRPLVAPILGFLGVILGVVIQAQFELVSSNKNHIAALAFEIIEKHKDFCSNSKYSEAFLWEVVSVAVNRDGDSLRKLASNPPCSIANSEILDIPEGPIPPPKLHPRPSSEEQITSSSNTTGPDFEFSLSCFEFKLYDESPSSYYCRNIFLVVKSNKNIHSIEVDWDDGNKVKRYTNIKFQTRGDLYSLENYYTLNGEDKRKIRVRAEYDDHTKSKWKEDTITLYL